MRNDKRVNFIRFFISGILTIFLTAAPAIAEPVLSNIETKDIEYNAGQGKISITKLITVTADYFYLRSATIRISSGFDASEDVLSFSNTSSISGTWNPNTGVLTLTGFASISRYQNALRNVKYENTNKTNPSTDMRIISFTVNDGINNSNTLSRNIRIISPDQPPHLSNIESNPVIYCVNSNPVALTSSLTIEDPDNSILSSAVIQFISGYTQDEDVLRFNSQNGIIGNWSNSSGRLTLTGQATLSQYQEAIRSITYENKNPADPASDGHEVSFEVSDGENTSNVLSRNIVHSTPTAVITGNASICSEGQTNLLVALTGTSPWEFSYRLNSGTPVNIPNVTSNTFNLTVNHGGTYTLVDVSDKYCEGKVSGSAVVNILPSPDVRISGLDPAYSKESTEWILLTGSPEGGEFSGPGVIPYGAEWYFIPALPTVGYHNIVYKYRASPESCYGYDTAVVRILEKSAAIEIEDDRTQFCQSDPPFTVTGINLINNNAGTFAINGGIGLEDHGNNTATISPSELEINQYTVTYTSFDGTTVDLNIEIGYPLNADFKWDAECFQSGQSILFTNTTNSPYGFLTEDSYDWEVYASSDPVSMSTRDIFYTFPEPGNYTVKLHIVNSNGCLDEVEKVFPLRPVFALAGQNYFENFEGEFAWQKGNSPAFPVNSWKLGMPAKAVFPEPYSGERYWYTDIPNSPAPYEESWIASPCFDFRGTEKPTLVAQIWRSFSDNRDGAKMEYSINDGISWNPVGSIDGGINWYNGYFGHTGEQSEGWTYVRDAGWIESRHALDFLKLQNRVQFRVTYNAYGSALGNEGIAVDDIRIVERNRTILIEHFTNSSDEACAIADSLLNSIVGQSGSNVIDLQYHTSYPDGDPFNEDNPIIPGTRLFYYGLAEVPYAIINGGMESKQRIDYDVKTLDQKQIGIESLYDSDFKLEVISMILEDTLYAEAKIASLQDVPLTELSVRIAVLEPVIENITGNNGPVYKSVVKAMLPDAAGNTLYKTWYQDELLSVREAWEMQNVYHPEDLRVVAFIQNEITKEIYQAALDTRGIVSGTDDHQMGNGSRLFDIYPNPAGETAYLRFPASTREAVNLELFNYLGQVVYTGRVQPGTSLHSFSTGNLPEGMYLLRLSAAEKMLGTGKLLIRHSR